MIKSASDVAVQQIVCASHYSAARAVDPEEELRGTQRVVAGFIGIHGPHVAQCRSRSEQYANGRQNSTRARATIRACRHPALLLLGQHRHIGTIRRLVRNADGKARAPLGRGSRFRTAA